MPHCDEGYISKEIEEIMNGRSVLQVALDLNMGLIGSKDATFEDNERNYKIISFYIDHWVSSKNIFDNLVLCLLMNTRMKYSENL